MYTLLQSGFHKILYLKEKLVMRRLFQKDLLANYVDFTCVREVRIGQIPFSVSYSNKVDHKLNMSLFNPTQKLFLKNLQYGSSRQDNGIRKF